MPAWQQQYPVVHLALAPEYRQLPQSEVETLLHGVLGEGVSLADAEGFFDDLGHTLSGVASAVAPIAQRALPGVVSGAASGAALGPYGMLGGALLGGLSSALSDGGAGGAPPRPQAPPGAPPAPPPSGRTAPSAPGTGGTGGAVAQLLGALGSPTVQQALSAMLMGRAGAPTVPAAGGSEVPVAGIMNLLGMLANRASAEWEEAVPSLEGEAFGEDLEAASPEARSAWLFERLLPPAGAQDEVAEDLVPPPAAGADDRWIDELYDELEAELLAETTADEAYYVPQPDAWSFNGHG